MGTLTHLEQCPPEVVPWALEVAELTPSDFTVTVTGHPAPYPESPNSTVIILRTFTADGEVKGFGGWRIELAHRFHTAWTPGLDSENI